MKTKHTAAAIALTPVSLSAYAYLTQFGQTYFPRQDTASRSDIRMKTVRFPICAYLMPVMLASLLSIIINKGA